MTILFLYYDERKLVKIGRRIVPKMDTRKKNRGSRYAKFQYRETWKSSGKSNLTKRNIKKQFVITILENHCTKKATRSIEFILSKINKINRIQ